MTHFIHKTQTHAPSPPSLPLSLLLLLLFPPPIPSPPLPPKLDTQKNVPLRARVCVRALSPSPSGARAFALYHFLPVAIFSATSSVASPSLPAADLPPLLPSPPSLHSYLSISLSQSLFLPLCLPLKKEEREPIVLAANQRISCHRVALLTAPLLSCIHRCCCSAACVCLPPTPHPLF